MNPRLILINVLSCFGYDFHPPVRLGKQEPKSRIDEVMDTLVPYIILFGIILLLLLVFFMFLRFGGACFGTEANRFYNGGLV